MTTIAFPEELWEELEAALTQKVETAAVIIAGSAAGSELTLLARSIEWIPDECYLHRDGQGLEIASTGYVPSLKRAADDGSVAIFFHTHPGGRPGPSQWDDEVDAVLAGPFKLRTGQRLYASLILGGTPGSAAFSGRVDASGSWEPIERLRVVGRRFRMLVAADGGRDLAAFDRQIRAFGAQGQHLLSQLHAAVVGAGGTGSAVFEQLIRLGVGRVTVIDDDVVTLTNLTRIHESARSDLNLPKVEVARRAADRISLGTEVKALTGRITHEAIAAELRHCDVIFGCTDDNLGRAVLSRLAYWYLTPVIDSAFLVDTDAGSIRGLFGRVTTVMPGAPCLICRRRLEPAGLQAEALPEEERERLAAEGYVPGLGEPDPSVGAFTTLVGMYAINELLERLIDYGRKNPPTEMLVLLHDHEISTTSVAPNPEHYCADRRNWGRGDTEPFLEQLWL